MIGIEYFEYLYKNRRECQPCHKNILYLFKSRLFSYVDHNCPPTGLEVKLQFRSKSKKNK